MSELIVYSITFGPTLFVEALRTKHRSLRMRRIFVQFVWVLSTPYSVVTIYSFQWIHASPVAIKLPNVQKPSLQKSRNWRQWLLAAYHGPGAACTGLVCNVRNFSCSVAPCQPVLGQSPFENLPIYFCGNGLLESLQHVFCRQLCSCYLLSPLVCTGSSSLGYTSWNASRTAAKYLYLVGKQCYRMNTCVCVCARVCACAEHILPITELLNTG
jgi:hypothetical protein